MFIVPASLANHVEAVERQAGVALWRQIYQSLEREIAGGTRPAGQRLPTEPVLAARFRVNRHTLRRAMAALQADGLVRIERGHGTFVADPVIDYPVSRRTRYSEILMAAGREPNARLVAHAREPATAEAGEALGVAPGAPVLLIETIGHADDRPLALSAHYFPLPRFDGLQDRFAASGSISAALKAFGVDDYFRASTRVATRLPDERTAALLEQPRSQPVLVTTSHNVDADGWPIEFSISEYAGARVRLRFDSA